MSVFDAVVCVVALISAVALVYAIYQVLYPRKIK